MSACSMLSTSEGEAQISIRDHIMPPFPQSDRDHVSAVLWMVLSQSSGDVIHHVLPRCPKAPKSCGLTLTPSMVHSFTPTYSLAARDTSHRSSAGFPGEVEVEDTCTFRSARKTTTRSILFQEMCTRDSTLCVGLKFSTISGCEMVQI